jgi:hypothetical protein
MTLEEHVQALHDLLRTDHEDWIAEIQGWADAAAASGDVKRHRWYLEMIAGYEAIPKPWEPKEPTAAGGAHGSGGG